MFRNLSLQVCLSLLIASGVSAALSASAAYSVEPQITPTPTATPTPSTSLKPIVTPSPTPTPRIQTLEELQSKIRQRVFSSDVRRGRVGVKIVSLNSGKMIFENDSEKYFMPASNMKNFTVAAALEKLGPDFKFVTSVYANSHPDANGTILSDLRIYGRGDISISTAFFGTSASDPETYHKGIDRLVDRIAAAGVKRVEGSIVGDESHFKGFAIPGTWEWDDLQWYYGAEISALSINDNAVDISVMPGSTVGSPCVVTISPPNTLFQINSTCTTGGARRALGINKRLDRNVLEITGSIPSNDAGYRSSITITHPADLFVSILKQRLEKRGIPVAGTARTMVPNTVIDTNVEIAKLESPPFREIAAKTMKPSQNMFTETILWTLGEYARERSSSESTANGVSSGIRDSFQLGIAAVKEFSTSIGIPADGIVQHDGSGLSRHDLITPSAVVTLYTHMANKSRHAQVWSDSLTIGGVDGTLANRFRGTAAAGNIRGKTGTIDQVSALSGYMTTAAGERLVLSIVVNGVPETRTRTSLIDAIVTDLANFNGKIN
ncbi:MAG: D-alanyl-D-alanine carboxypeptidase/D-alanyl-D-alanine-endopeptidase [Pyrinomonadaceae bacterium]